MDEKFSMPTRFSFGVDITAKALVILCAILVVAYCIWTLDRGFEITDEAYYLLSAIHADSTQYYISAQHWISTGLWHITGSLAMFRAAGMFLLLASSALLALGVFSECHFLGLVENRIVLKVVVVAGSVVCALLYASTINLSPSYNLMASAGAYFAAGLVLFAVNCLSSKGRQVLFFLAGCAIGVEFINKASAGVSTLFLLLLWILIFDRLRSEKIICSLLMIFGVIISICILALANTTISDAVLAVSQGLSLFKIVQSETVCDRLLRYLLQFGECLLLTGKVFLIPLIAMVCYVVSRRLSFAIFGVVALLVVLVFGAIDVNGLTTVSIENVFFDSYLFGGLFRVFVQMIAASAMLLMALLVSKSIWGKSFRSLGLFVLLILLPYTVAMGTGNTMFSQVVSSLAPWGALISILIVSQFPISLSGIPPVLIGVCFIATVSLQIITSGWRPYQLSKPISEQNIPTNIGVLGEVNVDSGTYDFLTGLSRAADVCAISPQTPYFGLYNIPGVALALKAVPVKTPWLNNVTQAEFILDRLSLEDVPTAVIALKARNDGSFSQVPHQLISFSGENKYCGTVVYPFRQQKIQIWKIGAKM